MILSRASCKLLPLCCLILVTLWFAQPAHALEIPRDCSDIEMLQEKWETQYFYELKFNSYLSYVPALKCDSLPYKFVKAIWVLENIKVSPEFGNIYEQIKTHVKEFRIIPMIGLSYPVRANADTKSSKISLYLPAFGETVKKASYPWEEEYYVRNLFRLAATIVHELRHLQMPDYEHVDCPDGTPKGCDERFVSDIKTAPPISIERLFLMSVISNQNNLSEHDLSLISKDIDHIPKTSLVEQTVSE